MFCSECGTAREDHAKFCKECGHPFPKEASEPAAIPAEASAEAVNAEPAASPAEEVKQESAPVTEEEVKVLTASVAMPAPKAQVQQPEAKAEVPVKAKSSLLKPLLIIGGVLIGAALLLFAAYFVFFTGGKGSDYSLVYFKDNELLVKNNDLEKPYSVTSEIVDENAEGLDELDAFDYQYSSSSLVKINDAGDKLFFVDNVGDDGTANLYYRNPKEETPSGDDATEKGIRLASNVSFNGGQLFNISSDGNYVLYIKDYEDEEGGKLYLHNLTEEVLIDKDVTSFYPFSEDGSKFLYYKSDDDATDLYLKGVDPEEKKVKIDSDVFSVAEYTSNYEKIYYTKSSHDAEDWNDRTLYVKEDGKDKVKLISGFSGIEDASENGTFFFTRTTVDKLNLYDLVKDDLASSDANIFEPVLSNYQTEEEYTDWWGYTYTNTVTDYDAYYDDWDRYQEKMNRDSMRAALKNETVEDVTKELFLFEGDKEKKVTDEFSSSLYTDAESKTAIYLKKKVENADKLNLVDINSTYEVSDHYTSRVTSSDIGFIVLNGGKEAEMPEKAKLTESYGISEDGNKLYYIERSEGKDEGALVSWDIAEGKLTKKSELDENVYKYSLIDGKIWYYKDVKDQIGDLYTYADGKSNEVAYDVRLWTSTVYPSDDVVLYLSDYNLDNEMGTLYLSKGGEKTKIADDVSSYNYWSDSDIFYIADYRSKKGEGDLWEYKGKDEKTMLDDSVSTMLPLYSGYEF